MIFINEETQQFHLTNGQISYIFHVMKNGQLGHLYYGKALRDRDFRHFQDYENTNPSTTHTFEGDLGFSLETVRQEAPVYGKGDFRTPALILEEQNGASIADFRYKHHHTIQGKPKLEGLPATFAEKSEAETLVVTLEDDQAQVEWALMYTIFRDLPVLTRSNRLTNHGEESVTLKHSMSSSIDLPDADYEMVHLSGAWARERHIETRKLTPGVSSIGSVRGASSHQHNPFLALKREETTEDSGEAIGMQFVYSGNFLAQAEVDHYDTTRLTMGIHPQAFQWKIAQNESFQNPEVILTYTENGLNEMSQTLHDLHRKHLIAPRWMEKERPILINNWEATYFDFNEEKLDRFTDEARDLGVELFVLDDGWFGQRNDDTTSLGDWFVDEKKLPNGIGTLAKKVKEKGLQFGLWFEPEMISPESELMKQHPEWVVGPPHRHQTLERNQKVLDFANPQVVDYLFERMSSLIEETGLDYIKWDMNRNITEPHSQYLDDQVNFFHQYILGVYELYERLTTKYPDVLFESCAGGGGRFDAGVLYYAPQAWTSDDTDAVERLKIQYGTSLVYPLCSMGSHVSAVPNHQTYRNTPLKFRADVAYFGTFGYEFDPSQLTDEEKAIVKEQIIEFQSLRRLIHSGTFYRLSNPFNHQDTAWMVVSEEKAQAVVGWYRAHYYPNPKNDQVLKLRGLDSEKQYEVEGTSSTFYGDELMYHGLPLGVEFNGANHQKAERSGDHQSQLFVIKEKK
ncbi:alpha-galactosidase [Halobacillus aidingensis]|uniref:Alpha-galactosidase n=1 Tax=Halobacillus aidingensis TaxID=240303 RepID=A0A1H0KVG5_HALAD|nr:alpha-galactosidase [Halobacillus aidingensis]SDO59855.1 alpha-galactosidase [Halobacillus aidingensis]